jgi:GNAT superfamily N-acetyltransferase
VNEIKTRAAESADAEGIAQLVNAAFRPERFFIDADRTNPDKVRELLEKGRFLLAEDDGKLLACVYVELRGERGYFGLLAVDPARQRAGTGSRLIDAAEDYCRAAGCRFLDLTVVNLRKELPGYYRQRGYVENGTLPFPGDQYPPKIPCHLIKMSKPLEHEGIARPNYEAGERTPS